MDSYTNPYGSQPSVPNGGQLTPTNYSPQGDIILTPSTKKLDLKRILILAGFGLAVVVLFVVVAMNMVNKNRTESEVETANRKQTLNVIENFYQDYKTLLENYAEIGYNPSEDMANELDNTSKLFIAKKMTVMAISVSCEAIESEFEAIAATDFSNLGDGIDKRVKKLASEIEADFENIKINANILESFYDTFILPVQEDLDADTATYPCEFSVSSIPGLIVDGFAANAAIRDYTAAYCSVNDDIYYGTFSGRFDSPYVRDAKKSLIDILLNVNDQSEYLRKFGILLKDAGSELIIDDFEEEQA